MTIKLLDDSLLVQVYHDPLESGEADDDICVALEEQCPDEEKILKYDSINIYLTEEQALMLAQVLIDAVKERRAYLGDDSDEG